MSIGNVEETASNPQLGVVMAPRVPVEASAAPRLGQARLGELLRHREVRRIVAYLVAGGISALVTITTTAVLINQGHFSFLWAAIAGTELGILVSFALNDRMAFHDLDGKARPLVLRIARYHITCAFGQSLILLFSLALHDLAQWNSVFAQALPIGVATVVNFLMHRFWTYRGERRPIR